MGEVKHRLAMATVLLDKNFGKRSSVFGSCMYNTISLHSTQRRTKNSSESCVDQPNIDRIWVYVRVDLNG